MLIQQTKNIAITLVICLLASCTEPFVIETFEFESVLVVESTITNEMKKHVIKLSQTSPLEGSQQILVGNASIEIRCDDGNLYIFSQDPASGHYLADEPFMALPEVAYILKINTQDGRSYASSPVTLPPPVAVSRVYTELISKDGEEGIQIFVDAENADVDARYFRYEYEETYKVLLPNPSPFTWEIVNYNDFNRTYQIVLTPRRLDLACYSSRNSSGIVQTSTVDLDANRIIRYPVRFIEKSDPVIKERYSILVKQYVQSLEAFNYYETLADLAHVESLLSQGQPGYVIGNIISVTDPEEKVLGFFEASAVSSQRIFFGDKELGLDQPEYFVICEHLISTNIGSAALKRKLENENYQVFFFEVIQNRPVYHISQSICSECALFSTHIKPDFWED